MYLKRILALSIWLSILPSISVLTGCGSGGNYPALDLAKYRATACWTPPVLPDQPELPNREFQTACETRAIEFERALNAGDAAFLKELFECTAFTESLFHELEISEADRATYANPDELIGGYIKAIAKAVRGGASYKFVRLRIVEGRPQALFRLISNNVTQYQDVLFYKAGEAIRMQDIYNYINGEWFSQMLRNELITMKERLKTSTLERLTGSASQIYKNADLLATMEQALQNRNFDAGLAAYHRLPLALQLKQSVLLKRLSLANLAGNNGEWERAWSDYRQIYSGPAAGYPLIDLLIMRESHKEALEALDRFNAYLGGDGYLSFQRAYANMKLGRWSEAKLDAERAIREDSTLAEPHHVLVEVALQQKDFERVADELLALHARFQLDLDHIDESPIFAEFRESEAYDRFEEGTIETLVLKPVEEMTPVKPETSERESDP